MTNTTCSIGDFGPISCSRGVGSTAAVASASGDTVASAGRADALADGASVPDRALSLPPSIVEHVAIDNAAMSATNARPGRMRARRPVTCGSGTLDGTVRLRRRELVVPSDDDGDVLVAGEDLRRGADDLDVT